MSQVNPEAEIAAMLDRQHAVANLAFANRNIDAYRRVFASNLHYTQPDGSTVSFEDIIDSVTLQFKRLTDCRFDYVRERLTFASPNDVVEKLALSAWIDLRIYFAFKQRWTIARNSTFTWHRFQEGWQVVKVVAHHETVDISGIRPFWRSA